MSRSLAISNPRDVPADAPRPMRVDLPARRHPLVAEIEASLRSLDAATGPLAVGVSGGADSVALLIALVVIRDRGEALAFRPTAVHVHHHLRGDEADADADHVEDLATRFGVPFLRRDVHPGDVTGNRSAAAREMRYAALADAARSIGAAAVAVAHHADDQLETMLMAIARGTGLDGLRGMAETRAIGPDITLLRPMLAVRATVCRELCGAAGVTWREDASNDDPGSRRARLRRDVLPVLHELWPDAARRASGTARAIEAARSALESTVHDTFGPPDRHVWPRPALARLDTSIIAAGLRRAVAHRDREASARLGRRQLDAVAAAVCAYARHPRSFDWPNGWRAHVRADYVKLVPPKAPAIHLSQGAHAE